MTCPICGKPVFGNQIYCTLNHREKGKRLRRKARETGILKPETPSAFWPDPAEPQVLQMLAEQLVSGQISGPIWFHSVLPEGREFQMPGISLQILGDHSAKLSKI